MSHKYVKHLWRQDALVESLSITIQFVWYVTKRQRERRFK